MTMNVKMIRAPWTDSQVQALNRYQTAGRFHPYTCGNRADHVKDKEGLLIATTDGWTCPECRYVQTWAWRLSSEGNI